MSKVFDVNGNAVTTFHKEDGKTILKTTEDVSPILALNKIDRNHSNQRGSYRKAATIPVTIWRQWREDLKAQGRNPDPWHPENRPWLMATLNSRDWLKLRTNEDKL